VPSAVHFAAETKQFWFAGFSGNFQTTAAASSVIWFDAPTFGAGTAGALFASEDFRAAQQGMWQLVPPQAIVGLAHACAAGADANGIHTSSKQDKMAVNCFTCFDGVTSWLRRP
jgi:hypothetical protein